MFEVKIPERWKKIRFSGLFIENKEKNINFAEDNALQFYFGTIIQKKKFELTEELIETYKKYTVVKPEDIVINGLNLNYDFVSQRVGVVTEKGIITSAYLVLRMREKINIAYYGYLLKALDSQKFFHGLGSGVRLTLSYNDLRNIFLPVPPLDEQEKIVRYLDKKTSDMTKFIDAKKKQVELLKELKRSIISDAVTNGLYNDSSQWQKIKLRQILKPVSKKNRPDLPLLSVTREQGIIIRNIESKEINHNFIPPDLNNYKVVRRGQFVINKMKAWQGSYGVSDYDGIVSPAYYVFDLDFPYKKFFHYVIRSQPYIDIFAKLSSGIRVDQWDLPLQSIKQIPFNLPSLWIQKEIADYLDVECAKIENLIEAIQKEISLVEELRKSLISEVVTGKIDVRELI